MFTTARLTERSEVSNYRALTVAQIEELALAEAREFIRGERGLAEMSARGLYSLRSKLRESLQIVVMMRHDASFGVDVALLAYRLILKQVREVDRRLAGE